MIKKILVFLIKRYELDEYINMMSASKHIDRCKRSVVSDDIVFYPEAEVYNMPGNPNLIRLGSGAHVRGTLLVLRYGGKIEIGNNCYIGDGTRVWSGDSIKIGSNVLISHNVNIIDTNSHELDSLKRSESCLSVNKNGPLDHKGDIVTSPIVIGDNVWINFNAVILKGVIIGEGAIIAANSVVTKDVLPWTVVAGNPARIIKYLK